MCGQGEGGGLTASVDMSGTSVMVTGASGFLGSLLARELLRYGAKVFAVTSKDDKSLARSLGLDGGNESLCRIDARDFTSIRASMGQTDILFNCAFPRSCTGEVMARGLDFISNIISCANRFKVARVINISSQSVYSKKRTTPVTEADSASPETPYAVGKYAVEVMLRHLCGDVRMATNIRLASLIGPGFDQRMVNKMAVRAAESGSISVVSGSSRFGFLDVADAVAALLRLAASDDASWEFVYNVGSRKSYTPYDLAIIVRDCFACLGRSIEVRCEGQEKEKTCSEIDSSRFAAQFGEFQTRRIEDSVMEIACEVLRVRGMAL